MLITVSRINICNCGFNYKHHSYSFTHPNSPHSNPSPQPSVHLSTKCFQSASSFGTLPVTIMLPKTKTSKNNVDFVLPFSGPHWRVELYYHKTGKTRSYLTSSTDIVTAREALAWGQETEVLVLPLPHIFTLNKYFHTSKTQEIGLSSTCCQTLWCYNILYVAIISFPLLPSSLYHWVILTK